MYTEKLCKNLWKVLNISLYILPRRRAVLYEKEEFRTFGGSKYT